MCETFDDHEGSVSIGGRLITNFRFVDDIVVHAEEKEEADVLVVQLMNRRKVRCLSFRLSTRCMQCVIESLIDIVSGLLFQNKDGLWNFS